MTGAGKISSAQFFCILFVSRLLALFTFILTGADSFPAGDRMIVFLPFFILGLFAAVPVMLVLGRKEDRTLFALTDGLSPALTRVCCVLYAGGAVWSAAVSIVRFELFMSTVMFAGAVLTGLIALLVLSAAFAAGRGIETIGRMSVAVLTLTAVSLIYVGLTTAGEFETANLEPPLQNGIWDLIKNSSSAAARTGELAALLILAPEIRGKIKKGYVFWLLAFGLTASVLFTLILGVTGAYGERQMFQLYALTVLSRIGVAERLDPLICAIWVLCSFTRLAFHLCIGAMFLRRGFPKAQGNAVYFLLGAPVFAVFLMLSGKTLSFSAVLGSGVNEIVFSVLLIGLPLAVLLANRIKRKPREAKA